MSDVKAIVFIPLTQGKVAVVDFDDFGLVRDYKWNAALSGTKQKRWYVARMSRKSDKLVKPKVVYMHQMIMRAKGIDHIDNAGLNNMRANLRLATTAENSRGKRRKNIGTTSRFRGVAYCKRDGNWQAIIRQPASKGTGKQVGLGRFEFEEDAARAWDAAAIKCGYAYEALNFPS